MILSTVIPDAVKNAVAEYARLLIAAGAMPNSGGEVPVGLQSVKAGSVEIHYNPALTSQMEDAVPSAVLSIINFVIESRAQSRVNISLIRM
jgi:hypothetical protein